MAIAVNQNVFTLCTKNSMYQMKADELGVLLHTYYGKKTEQMDFSYLISEASDDHFPEIPMMQKWTENILWIRFLRSIPAPEAKITGKVLLQ